MNVRDRILVGAMLTFAMIATSCTITMMAAFLTGEPGGADLHALLLLQTAATPVAVAILVAAVFLPGMTAIWRAIPPWLVLAVLLLNSLVIIGELSLLLRLHLTDSSSEWFEHIPLLSALLSSLAFCALYAWRYPAGDDARAGIRRW